jgi:photosystem II stability/assembly factor-like uncharacterized protein
MLMTAVARAGARLVAVGERGTVLLSDDRGQSWRQARSVPVSVTLTRVQFVGEHLGWATGHSGVVLHTRDGGQTWVKQLDGRQAAKIELAQAQAEGGSPERLGNAEHLLADGPDKPLLGLYFADEMSGWVVGAYGLALRTRDGGASWQSLIGRLDNPKGRHLYGVVPLEDKLFVVGEQGAMYRSADGGATFSALTTPSRGTYFGAVACGHRCLLAYGLRGNAFRTTDAGEHWQVVAVPQVTLTAGLQLSDSALVLANEAGQLLLSQDAGRTFAEASMQAANSMVGLLKFSDERLIAAGNRNMISINLKPTSAQGAGQ